MSSGFVGTWEVTKYEPCQDSNYIKGIRFRLDSNGDVTWFVPEELKSVPLFNCEIYDTSASLYSAQESTCLRFGEYAGHVIEFKSDQRKPKDTVILSSESFLYTLHCKRVPEEVSEDIYQVPFSLLTALEEGYFSDLVITSKNDKQFHTHSLVLKIVGPDVDWHSSMHPLSNLLEEVLGTILHYMYTECLPENLSEATAQRVIMAITDLQFLNKLITMCKLYLRNIALKKQIIGLVNDMHDCLDKLINHLGEKRSSASDSLISNPDQLCFVVKQCFRDAAVAVVKVIELCDLYSKKKPELTKNEQHEIIRYGKSRFHIFLAQIQRFLQLLKDTFGSMSPYQKTDVAIFLVPEVTGILYMLTQLMIQIEGAIESIIAVLNPDDLSKSKSSFGNACTSFLYTKEVKKLRQFSELVACSLDILDRKRQSFMEMTNAQKVRSIFRNIEQSIDEIPLLFLIRLEEVTESSDKGLGWRDFKFCFQVGTSKISNVVQLMATHREEIQEVALQVCELVQRDAFNRSLQNMGILEPAAGSSQEEPEEKSAGHSTPFQNYTHKMNLVESFCISPKAPVSVLSRNLLDQFRKSCNTDMEFEIDNSADVDSSSEEVESPTTAKQSCVINAHRVVVASRCDWFRKALLSGMREDIDKKIVIHDTNPTMFKIFLEYLYTGGLSPSLLTNEQLVDLLVLSDRFEVETLKQACETALESTVDAENAIYLLSLADNYNAISLRNYCLDFIAQHQELTESDVFCELQSDLQAVIFDHIWTQPLPKKSSSKHDRHSSSVTTSDIERHFATMNLHQDTGASVQHDLNRLERCISQIRYVIGDDATREQLVQVILAADFDLCRAINYYYSKNN